MNEMGLMKKTQKSSYFKVIKTGSDRYKSEGLEIGGYDVLQVMVLKDSHVIVEYGKWMESEED